MSQTKRCHRWNDSWGSFYMSPHGSPCMGPTEDDRFNVTHWNPMRISSNTSHIFTKLVLCHPIQTSAYEEALLNSLIKQALGTEAMYLESHPVRLKTTLSYKPTLYSVLPTIQCKHFKWTHKFPSQYSFWWESSQKLWKWGWIMRTTPYFNISHGL